MGIKLKQRTYKTEDGQAVPEGHPAAAFLVASEGKEITEEEAKSLGISKDGTIGKKEAKQPTEDKEAEKSEDKGHGPESAKSTKSKKSKKGSRTQGSKE